MKLKTLSVFSAIVFASLLAAPAADADMRRGKYRGEAELAESVAQPKETIIKGITWRCEGSNCSATANDWPGLDNFTKQCRTVAKELGPLTKFRSGGRIATKAELSNCNAAANLARRKDAGNEALAKQ